MAAPVRAATSVNGAKIWRTAMTFPPASRGGRNVDSESITNKRIARSINIATKTVANHVSNILSKLQFADRAAAIVAARRAGLVADRPDPD